MPHTSGQPLSRGDWPIAAALFITVDPQRDTPASRRLMQSA
jgi:hypothetical protein